MTAGIHKLMPEMIFQMAGRFCLLYHRPPALSEVRSTARIHLTQQDLSKAGQMMRSEPNARHLR